MRCKLHEEMWKLSLSYARVRFSIDLSVLPGEDCARHKPLRGRTTSRRIHTYHAVPLPCGSFPFDLHSAVAFDSHLPWHGMFESALCVNQTRPHCVNQMGKTQSKPLSERYGRGTAWERHGMFESAFTGRGADDEVSIPGESSIPTYPPSPSVNS
jgi:hypothetical protein